MASIELEQVEKTYPNGHRALSRFDLTVQDGELMVLVGPSGSGKSTALRIVAGLESPSAGRVLLGGREVTHVPPQERDVAMVFQSYALYPHMTVRENLAFGMRMRGVAKHEIARRTEEMARRLSIAELLQRKPAQLSGGQRQRVALGRALVREPSVFLLDEPLSNLDAKLRAETRAEIGRLHASLGVTTMYVTHDQEEAMTLGDRVAVLGAEGRIEQLAPPLEIYQRPASAFVAEFIGLPKINWFEGELTDGTFRCADFSLGLAVAPQELTRVRLGVRPHDLTLTATETALLHGTADWVEALGPSLLVHAASKHGVGFRVLVSADHQVRRGDVLSLSVRPDRAHVFAHESGRRVGA